jgi:hypothetical protein
VCCKSRSLVEAETRYSTIERECLAAQWLMKKLRRFLLGRKFVLRTDHKPLVGLLDENKYRLEANLGIYFIYIYYFSVINHHVL